MAKGKSEKLVKVAMMGKPRKAASKSTSRPRGMVSRPRLLSGGNPQIAKGDGDGPVHAYIAAMSGGGPGWKRDVGRRLDALIVRAVPPTAGVRKAVKWNSPFYGVEGDPSVGWFLSFHCFAKFVKVAFFHGAMLRPLPPGESKQKDVRYLDIREGDWGVRFEEAQLVDWVRQAAALPGWVP